MAVVPMDKDPRNAPPNDYTRPRTKEEIQRSRNAGKPAPASKDNKKKPGAKQKELTFGETLVANVKSIDKKQVKKHLIFDWFLPELIDQIVGFLKQAFYGDDDTPSTRSNARGSKYTAYGSRYRSGGSRSPQPRSRDDRRTREIRQNFKHITITIGEDDEPFENRLDKANRVISDLLEMLEDSASGFVRVKDLYSHDYVGFPTNNTMDSWGWFDLDEAYVDEDDPDGPTIYMPPAEELR